MKKRYHKDITLKIELSSTDEDKLDQLIEKLVENLNRKTTQTVKYNRLFNHRTTTIDSFNINTFPNK